MTKKKKVSVKRKWVLVPVPPTDKMLAAMSQATFLTDGSLREMARRFNGMIEALPRSTRGGRDER